MVRRVSGGFQRLRGCFDQLICVELPDYNKPIEVVCDALLTGMGAILLQRRAGLLHMRVRSYHMHSANTQQVSRKSLLCTQLGHGAVT